MKHLSVNNLYGKFCPYCKTELRQDDDIIVCSDCNMPHHKDCWIENKGCTTFGCVGTIDIPKEMDNNDFNLSLDDFDMVRCKQCGSLMSSSKLHCEKCGNRLKKSTKNVKAGYEWIHWNWYAFAFSNYWLIYHKIYWYGIILFILNATTLIINIQIFIFSSLAIHISVGAIGDYLCTQSLATKKSNCKCNSTNITAVICEIAVLVMIVIEKLQ